MSVTVVSHDAVQEVKNATTSKRESFFALFGTDNCLLDCKASQESEKIKTRHGTGWRGQAPHGKQSSNPQNGWFKIQSIAESASRGCGSCRIVHGIIDVLFPVDRNTIIDSSDYSVSPTFTFKRRLYHAAESSVEEISLFQPPNPGVHLLTFPKSKFLFSNKDASILRLREWLDDCVTNHNSCSQQSLLQEDRTRPSRLLHLAPLVRGSANGIRLVETKSGHHYRYACLTHRWDRVIEALKMTLQKLPSAKEFIDMESLPANFRHAIWIARQLSIDYLWIDSLCIIQEGDDEADLNRELSKMGYIYRSSHLTIAAVSSGTSAGGCFASNTEPDMCIKVLDRFNRPIIIGARILDRKGRPDSFDAFNHRYPLLSRGWVLQERLMSSRLLECTYGEFAFSCLENQQCECESSLAPHGNSSQLALAIQPSFRRLLHAPGNAHRNKLSETWNTIISRYMQHELTETQDVLPAVAGIAEAMSIALNSYQYVAGMWKETLAEDLLWYVMQRRRTRHPQARPADSTAPSWSWASVSMGQAIAHMRIHPDRSLSENKLLLRKDTVKDICAAPLVQEVPFGKMSSNARLRIKSTLYPWYLRWYCKASERGSSTTKGKGRRGGRSKADLHILSKSSAAVCQAETAPLPIRGKNVEVLFDDVASLSSTKPGIDREPFVKCDARPPIRCSLGRIYLLPALHQRSDSWNLNVFLILQKMSSSYGDASCYARMGLFRLVSEDSSWEEITRGLANPQREEFWVL